MSALLQAHRVETTLTQDGTLMLDHLPFHAGDAVEVIVLPLANTPLPQGRYSLRGMPIQYERPTEPVAENEWEAAT